MRTGQLFFVCCCSSDFFPNVWYSYSIRCGLDNEDTPTTFVIINVYPIRYSPINNKLSIINSIELVFKFNEPGYKKLDSNLGEYDLVIIAPIAFENELQTLVEHKIKYGMKTFLKTTEDIYSSSYPGRDKPEKIKYDLTKPQGVASRAADLSKSRRLLGWSPKVSYKEGFKRTIDWYSKARNKGYVKKNLQKLLMQR